MDPLVSKHDLVLGKPIQGDILDLHGNFLLRKGSVIESPALVASLLARGAIFHRDGLAAPTPPPRHLFSRKSNASPFESLEELCIDLRVLSFQPELVANFVGSLRSTALSLIDAVERDPEASLASIFLNVGEHYSIRHQIHAAILAVVMTKELAVSHNDRIALVCAALTMNLAFLEYQDCLNERVGGLSADERLMISKHSEVGEQILITAGVVDPVWLLCVRHHHEQWDGSGYPDGLAANNIPLLSQILQMADMFSARISVRSWGQKELANATMADLLKSAVGRQCNPVLINALIKSLGAFPPGSFVQLANDETAIVVRRGSSATCPIVYSLTSRGLQLGAPVRRDTSVERYQIKALLPQATVDTPLRLHTLWGL